MAGNSRASKYLGFDALKGLNDDIKESESCANISFPIISDDEKDEMDDILFNCLVKNKRVLIKFYKNGVIEEVSDFILRIDTIDRRIILMNRLKIDIPMIIDLKEKTDWL